MGAGRRSETRFQATTNCELSAKEHGLDLLVADDATLLAALSPEFGPAIAAVRSIVGGEPYRRAYDSIFESMRRLNRLPRTHTFWRNTNLRPTYYKLPEYCELLLADDPADEMALWCLGTLETIAGDRFGQDFWLRLHRLGEFPLPRAPCPAYWASGGSFDYQFA